MCLDTRSREIRNNPKQDELHSIIRGYQTSNGLQLYISFEDVLGYLYGFTRLQLSNSEHNISYEGLGLKTAIIRELHVYGQLSKIAQYDSDKTQHQ